MSTFDDVLHANGDFAKTYTSTGASGYAAKGLAVLTCMDSRLDPLAMLGLVPGDAKILRNAGARASQDAIRSLILATHLLGVERICVVQHTDCRMSTASDAEIAETVSAAAPGDATGYRFLAFDDQRATLEADVAAIRACDLLAPGVQVGGFLYDVLTGILTEIVPA